MVLDAWNWDWMVGVSFFLIGLSFGLGGVPRRERERERKREDFDIVFFRIIFFRDRTLCVQDVLRKTFTAPQRIDRCQTFDTINKFSDVSVGNCDHLLQGILQRVRSLTKIILQTSIVDQLDLTVYFDIGYWFSCCRAGSGVRSKSLQLALIAWQNSFVTIVLQKKYVFSCFFLWSCVAPIEYLC